MTSKRTHKVGGSESEETNYQPQQNHFQQSAENVGGRIKDDLVTNISQPMGLAMADVIYAEALRTMGEALRRGETGPLTNQMLGALRAGVTNPLDNWRAEIETWYAPVALLPSSNESTPL